MLLHTANDRFIIIIARAPGRVSSRKGLKLKGSLNVYCLRSWDGLWDEKKPLSKWIKKNLKIS